MKLNDKNYVLAYGNKKCSNIIIDAKNMDNVLAKDEIYLSVLEDPNDQKSERKIYKISDFKYETL